jgi:hypothetical protein
MKCSVASIKETEKTFSTVPTDPTTVGSDQESDTDGDRWMGGLDLLRRSWGLSEEE